MDMLIKAVRNPAQDCVAEAEPTEFAYPRIDFSDYLRVFGFCDALYPPNAQDVGQVLKHRPQLLADLLGAQYAALRASGLLRPEVVCLALRCCRDFLRDQGFETIEPSQMAARLSPQATSIIISPGCQSWELLVRRVSAAVDCCMSLLALGRRVVVCFSGAHPGNESAKIPREAADMRDIFLRRITARGLGRAFDVLGRVVTESGSTTTAGNIRNVAKVLHVEMSNPCNVLLITSSFHVHRLYFEFRDQILARQFPSDPAPAHGIENVIAIPAEGFTGHNASYQPRYIKQLMFEVYRHLLFTEQFRAQLDALESRKRRRRRSTTHTSVPHT